jgi:hypothetical protein
LTVDGYFLQSFDGSILIRYFGDDDIVFIPRTVEIIGSSCFSYCESLSSVLIESGSLLRRIEPEAFFNSSLPSIVIPRSVEIISSSCFSHCNSLSSVSVFSDVVKTIVDSIVESMVIWMSRLTKTMLPKKIVVRTL